MITDPHLDEDARQALATGEAVTREVLDADGAWQSRVVEPYRSDVGGVIVTYKPLVAARSSNTPQHNGTPRSEVDNAVKETAHALTLGMRKVGVWTLKGDGSRLDWDEGFAQITGLTGSGLSLSESGFVDCLALEDRPIFEGALEAALQGDEAQDIELRFCPPGEVKRWLRVRCERMRTDGGDLIVGILADVTDRKSDKERSEFMMRELDHRVKNLLAIILSIAEITGRSNTDIATYKDDFRSRLESMARTHNLLAQTQWSGADLRKLVEQEVFNLAPKDAVTLEGPSLEISPSATQSLAMFFHELTANALKHGALAVDSGRIAIRWAIDQSGEARLHLTWTESGGETVIAPSKEGFGGKVMNRIVKRQLDAEVTTHWHAHGMELSASIPLKSIAASSTIGEANG